MAISLNNIICYFKGFRSHKRFLKLLKSENKILENLINRLKTSTQFETIILILACRILFESRCIGTLVPFGYYLEAFSILRSVMETILYIELFNKDPKMADEWQKEGKHIKIGLIKDIIDLDKKMYDDYQYLSQFTHPKYQSIFKFCDVVEIREKGHVLDPRLNTKFNLINFSEISILTLDIVYYCIGRLFLITKITDKLCLDKMSILNTKIESYSRIYNK